MPSARFRVVGWLRSFFWFAGIAAASIKTSLTIFPGLLSDCDAHHFLWSDCSPQSESAEKVESRRGWSSTCDEVFWLEEGWRTNKYVSEEDRSLGRLRRVDGNLPSILHTLPRGIVSERVSECVPNGPFADKTLQEPRPQRPLRFLSAGF